MTSGSRASYSRLPDRLLVRDVHLDKGLQQREVQCAADLGAAVGAVQRHVARELPAITLLVL